MEKVEAKTGDTPTNDKHHDLIEFAEEYFNPHERSPEGKLSNPEDAGSSPDAAEDILELYNSN